MSRPYQPPNPGINKKSTVKRREAGRSNQPIDSIEWVDPHTLHANDFNPNRLSRKDMRLLKISLLESGWLAPVVATEDNEVVDGFHRWTLSKQDAEVLALGDGAIPIVRWTGDRADHQMTTIRMNRARGNHYVVNMAEIVDQLSTSGLDDEEIAERLQMDEEEVFRLLQRGKIRMVYDEETGKMKEMDTDGFGDAWAPDYATDDERQEVRAERADIAEETRKGRTKTKPVVGKGD